MLSCKEPDSEEFRLLLKGQLDETREKEIAALIESNSEVRARFEAASGADRFGKDFDPTESQIDDFSTGNNDAMLDDLLEYLEPSDVEGALGKLGRYTILGEAGRGGMSLVLRAFDPVHQREVAIKWLDLLISRSQNGMERFRREIQAQSKLSHPNILELYSFEEVRGRPFCVTPFIAGETLSERLKKHPEGLGLDESIRIATAVASALEQAHDVGLIHRDLKPGNIMLDSEDDHVWLLDFGLAADADLPTLTRTGMIVGTPECMSPEQSRGESVDERSDLFSLGVIIHRMVTGEAPFRGDNVSVILHQIAATEPKALREISRESPPWLSKLTSQLLEKSPEERPKSAAEVCCMLEARKFQSDQPVRFYFRRMVRHASQRRAKIALFFLGLLGIGLGGVALADLKFDQRIVNSQLEKNTGHVISIKGKWGVHETLADAVTAAASGDRIVINHEGEYQLELPVHFSGKSLSIEAAEGKRPVIFPPEFNDFPFAVTDGELHFENITFIRDGRNKPHMVYTRSSGSITRCIIRKNVPDQTAFTANSISLRDCPKFVVTDCVFQLRDGDSAIYTAQRESTPVIQIRNSIFMGMCALAINSRSQNNTTEAVSISFDRCTLFTSYGIYATIGNPAFEGTANFDASILYCRKGLIGVAPNPATGTVNPIDVSAKNYVLYSAPGSPVVAGMEIENEWIFSIRSPLIAVQWNNDILDPAATGADVRWVDEIGDPFAIMKWSRWP